MWKYTVFAAFLLSLGLTIAFFSLREIAEQESVLIAPVIVLPLNSVTSTVSLAGASTVAVSTHQALYQIGQDLEAIKTTLEERRAEDLRKYGQKRRWERGGQIREQDRSLYLEWKKATEVRGGVYGAP